MEASVLPAVAPAAILTPVITFTPATTTSTSRSEPVGALLGSTRSTTSLIGIARSIVSAGPALDWIAASPSTVKSSCPPLNVRRPLPVMPLYSFVVTGLGAEGHP